MSLQAGATDRKGELLGLCFLIVLGLGVRYAYWRLYPFEPFADAQWYHSRAALLAQGEGYVDYNGNPTAYWPVGFPLYLSLFYRVLGSSSGSIMLANGISSAAAIIWLYMLSREQIRSVARFVPAFLYAVYPDLVAFNSLPMSETLYTALLIGSTYYLYRFMSRSGRWTTGVVSGTLLALCVLVRPLALFAALFVWVGLQWTGFRTMVHCRRIFLQNVSRLFVVYGCVALITLPWIARNYWSLGGFVWGSTNGGINLLIGNHPGASGGYEDVLLDLMPSVADDQCMECELDRLARAKAVEHILSDPVASIRRVPAKLYQLLRTTPAGIYWSWKGSALVDWGNPSFEDSYMGFLSKALGKLDSALLMLFYCGLVLSLPMVFWDSRFVIPVALTVYFVAVIVVFFGDPRYRVPLLPFWGFALALLCDRILFRFRCVGRESMP